MKKLIEKFLGYRDTKKVLYFWFATIVHQIIGFFKLLHYFKSD